MTQFSTQGEAKTAPRFDRRRLLEARANAVRARLATHLDDLRGRLAELHHPAEGLRRRPELLLAASGAAAILVGCGTGYAVYRASTRGARARLARYSAWGRILARPEKVAPPPSGFLVPMLERGLVGVVVAALSTLTKHVIDRALEGRHTLPVVRVPAVPDPFPSPRR